MNTRPRCSTFRTLGLALLCLAATFPAFALDFFEDFDGAGVPSNHAGYWYFDNTIYPTQNSWNSFLPGDGNAYLTVDGTSGQGDYQIIGIGTIPINTRMEVRMKGALVTGYTGFIFTYASSGDEIDIELVPDDEHGEGGVHDPYAWSDARFNTITGGIWESHKKGIVDDTGSKVSHYEDDTFHTYTIDWFSGEVRFYIDGVHQQTNYDRLPQQSTEIILGFRDLDWTGEHDWSGTRTMTIDWLNVKAIDLNSPVAAADRYVTDPDTPITISGSGILANDTGSSLMADLVSDVAHGTLSLNTNGSFTYTPDSGFVGEDHFVYFANDGTTSKGESNAARVLLRVGQPIEWQKVDDSNANIAYSAGWGTYVGSGGYMNTEHYSETSGSTATFSFNGTQARYYGFKRNDLGKVNIYVDGVFIETLDLYSPTFLGDHMLFETDVLSSGSHTLTVELRGSWNSSSSGFEANIDAFSWIDLPPPPTDDWQKVDDDDANITYSSGWGTYVGSGGYLNTEHWSETTGSTAIFSFNGTQARYYAFKRNDLGEVNIYVDGVFIETLDLYSSSFLGDHMLFETDVLSSGSHTLTVELRGSWNSSSSGFEANIDAFSWIDGGGDTTAPTPNPMTWAQTPYLNLTRPSDNVATMTATTASDPDGGVQYYFDCIEAPNGGYWEGCQDSGWQTGSTFSDWYLISGNTFHYSVKARDALGNETGWSATATITIGGGNIPPTASISYLCTNLDCEFFDSSSDSGGTIVSWDWNFGDGSTSDTQNPSHTYGAYGSYTVSLTVTDDGGATDFVEETITLTDPGSADTMSVTSIVVDTLNLGGGTKSPRATVTIQDNLGDPVGSVYVTGVFTGDGAGTGSDTTDTSGSATLVSDGSKKGRVKFTFCVTEVTVTDVSGGSLTWDGEVEACANN